MAETFLQSPCTIINLQTTLVWCQIIQNFLPQFISDCIRKLFNSHVESHWLHSNITINFWSVYNFDFDTGTPENQG